jgi:fucose 4-O-acetylase-like acetyltransferase
VLFLCYVILAATYRPLGRLGPLATIAFAAVAIQFVPVTALGIWQAKWFFPWFGAGYLVAAYGQRVRIVGRELVPAALLVYALILYRALRIEPGIWEISASTMGGIVTRFGALLVAAKAALTAAGLTLTDSLVRSWDGSWWYRALQRFGTVSLGVYGAHLFFLHLPLGGGIYRVLLVFVASAALSLGLCLLFERSRILSAVFLGGGYRNPRKPTGVEAEGTT